MADASFLFRLTGESRYPWWIEEVGALDCHYLVSGIAPGISPRAMVARFCPPLQFGNGKHFPLGRIMN